MRIEGNLFTPFAVAIGLALAFSTFYRLERRQPAAAIAPASKTAVWVLAARAVGSHDSDPNVRNPDWMAEQLLGPEQRGQLAGNYMIDALNQDYTEAMSPDTPPPSPRLYVASVAVRTRYIDQKLLAAAAAGVHQVVNLGAGYDTRAYRFRRELRDVRVFEVDGPQTQAQKRERIEAIGGPAPGNLVYVSIDFEHQDVGTRLAAAGYDRGKPALFIFEGVTMYLPADAVAKTFRFVAGTPGNAIAFDYIPQSRLVELRARSVAERQIQDMVAAWGEPWVFAIADGETENFMRHVGLKLMENIPTLGAQAVRRYLTRSDGTHMADPIPPPLLGPGRYSYYVAYAIAE